MTDAQYIHQHDQLGAAALETWDSEVDACVAGIRRNALPAGRTEAFVAAVAQLQDRCAQLPAKQAVTGLTLLASTALLRLAEAEE